MLSEPSDEAQHSREAPVETINFMQLLSRCALLCFREEHRAKEEKKHTDGLKMMKS